MDHHFLAGDLFGERRHSVKKRHENIAVRNW
jgi:hypothetical protein